MRAVADEDKTLAVQQFCVDELNVGIDLACGPLVRAQLLRLAESEYVLMLVTHRIVSDVRSAELLMTEVGQLYQAFCQGDADPLPALPAQYAEYVRRQHHWLASPAAQLQRQFWTGHLAGAPEALSLFRSPGMRIFSASNSGE